MAAQPPGNTPWIQNGGVPSPIFLQYMLSLAQIGTSFTASLGSDININTGSYFDGPSVAQGSSGTWFASGQVTVIPATGTPRTFFAKLWDGSTVIDSGVLSLTNGFFGTISLSGIIASPAGNLRISVAQTNSDGIIKFNQSGNPKDSTISAIRIA